MKYRMNIQQHMLCWVTMALLHVNCFAHNRSNIWPESGIELIVFDNARISTPLQPYQVAIAFLKWYKQNRSRISFALVKGGGKDTNSTYRIDFKSVERYLNELKKSNFFSNAFLASLRKYLVLCDANFKSHPQKDFIAQGFETDLITKLSDDLDIMENVQTLRKSYSHIVNDTATVRIKSIRSQEIIFFLKKSSGLWKIDSINGDFPKHISHY